MHDVLRRAGFYHSLEAPVVVSGEFIGTINFARARHDRPFGVAEIRTASQAAEQLGLAVQRALRFERSGERASLMEAVLDRLPQAIVVTDLEGRLVYANEAATRRDGSSLLELAWPQIADAVAGFRAGSRRIVVGGVQAHAARAVTAGGPGTAGQQPVVIKSVRLPGEFGATLTLIYPCGADVARLPLWDILSPREQQIADWVSQGLTTRQIAERAVVTENTVKQHLKRIFAKADVGNRAELVQRVWAARSPDADPR